MSQNVTFHSLIERTSRLEGGVKWMSRRSSHLVRCWDFLWGWIYLFFWQSGLDCSYFCSCHCLFIFALEGCLWNLGIRFPWKILGFWTTSELFFQIKNGARKPIHKMDVLPTPSGCFPMKTRHFSMAMFGLGASQAIFRRTHQWRRRMLRFPMPPMRRCDRRKLVPSLW